MTKTTPTRAALMLVLLFVWMMPARPVAADREHQQIIADIRMLQEQAQQLQALMNGLGDAVKAMNARIDDQTALGEIGRIGPFERLGVGHHRCRLGPHLRLPRARSRSKESAGLVS